jgi:hypothetical protein
MADSFATPSEVAASFHTNVDSTMTAAKGMPGRITVHSAGAWK